LTPDDEEAYYYTSDGGVFINPKIGCRIETGAWNIYFMAGYKFQRIDYSKTYRWAGLNQSPLFVEQDMERFSVHLGLGWN
jgi:hypothetical protein